MGNKLPPIKAFTLTFNGRARELIVECGVSFPKMPISGQEFKAPPIHTASALWDTGATASAITAPVAKALGLSPITKAKVQTAAGETLQNVYLVNIYLPNKVFIPFVRVTECSALAGKFEILIGMDIITLGDFSITNVGNQTTFTYRVPSTETIDYVKEFNDHHNPVITSMMTGRNDLCYCGSGKKYKHCHWQADQIKTKT